MNTGFNSTSPKILFPALLDTNSISSTSPTLTSHSNEEGKLLWEDVNTFAIPGSTEVRQPLPSLRLPIPERSPSQEHTPKEDTTVFNISWGGDDTPPAELHPDEEEDTQLKLTRPLPKPRGIRKLPEPEPSPDGTIDEDTLKRRKNTDAARRSRMKKFLKVDQLENKVSTLQAENAKLTLSNAVLESEKRSLNAKENEYKKRIQYLEGILIAYGWDFDSNQPPFQN